ncbi:uncharacterized protein LOC106362581 [Brassica napus]|uniref:uncharacterized protein LOC106362581 n=1 Tax=Brassica napus TaxID=3708 RepID=UPI002079BD1E|nr:uncharacterized protein LOC106362581 [Brassica napus]
MLKLKPKLNALMRCNLGDGKSVSFWFDWWTDLGPLISVCGRRGTRDLRIPIDATVSAAAPNGHWSLPPARSDEAETLQVVLSTMQPPSSLHGKDCFLWRSGAHSFLPKFSSKATWNFMSVLSRLPTRDRLISWGMQVIVYSLWRERNVRIFKNVSSTAAAIAKYVDRSMRDRLLSLAPPADGHDTLLLLYLSIRRLFPP